jgi:cysteine sulfinate desulfinase/cysteine desulfurase-like protein
MLGYAATTTSRHMFIANARKARCVLAEMRWQIPNVAAPTGSACHSGETKLSPVLKAMGIAPEVGMGAIRFSLGRSTTQDEIEDVVHRLKRAIRGVPMPNVSLDEQRPIRGDSPLGSSLP